jgi:hypothetical protein
MKRFLHTSSILLFIITILFASPSSVYANEGDGGGALEMEVNGYHVTLSSQTEWAKGENTLVVTITDSMGMPVSDADVEILLAPKAGEHAESETDSHGSGQPEEAMPGMDMGDEPTQEPVPGVMSPNNPSDTPAHDEEFANLITMTESEHGSYTAQSHLESAGEYDVHVMFHVNGEMLQADFLVTVTGSSSKTVVLWSFVAVNVALVVSAGVMKKQKTITVKGA